MSRILNFGLLLLVVALVSVSGASAYSGVPGWYDPNGGGTHTTSNPTPEVCTGCHNVGGARVCTTCHSNPFTLTVVANPTTVTAGTPASVTFTVTRKNSVQAVGGVTVDLSGVATGSGTTLPAGTVDINVNANSAGTITADATRTGYESGTATVTATAVTPVLETIMVSPPTATLSIGDTPVFTATALDQNGDPMEGINITWASNDIAVGTVSPENVLTGSDGNATATFTAIATGTAMVNASNDSVIGSATVTVLEVVVPLLTTITVSPSTAALTPGDIRDFTATALDQNGDPMEGINITWASNDIAVGTVAPENVLTGSDGNATATFTAIAPGTAMVNASNDSVIGSATVTVSEVVVPLLTTITVSPSTAALTPGDIRDFTATALDQNGDPMEGINITWASNDIAVGTVAPENVLTGSDGNATTTFTAIVTGTAMVNASNDSVMGSATVTVSEVVVPLLTTITVSPSTAALTPGDIRDFTATALDQNGDPMEGINITWASNDIAVGTVSPVNVLTGADGNATTTFTAIVTGTAMVNASNDSVMGSATVTVSEEVESMIKNPGFESGTASWRFFTDGNGKFTTVSPGFEGTNAAKITLMSNGSNIQLYQKDVTLKPKTNYRLSFAAKSNNGRNMRAVLFKHGSPFTGYGLRKEIDLSEEWQTFTMEFTTKGFTKTVNDGRLMFYFAPYAKAGTIYWIDNVILEEIPSNT